MWLSVNMCDLPAVQTVIDRAEIWYTRLGIHQKSFAKMTLRSANPDKLAYDDNFRVSLA